MGVVILPSLFILGFTLVFSYTGGFASAIAGGGREDRTLLQNAGIGLVGWLVAAAIFAAVKGRWPEEFSIGLGILALVCAVVFARLLNRRAATADPAATNE